MSDVNHVSLSGRLTRKPDMRETPSGIPVTNFILANNQYRSGQQKTTFVRCAIWSKGAEYASKLDKGDHIFVEGQLEDDNFLQDKDNPDSMTKGRLKLGNAKITLLHRKLQQEAAEKKEEEQQIE